MEADISRISPHISTHSSHAQLFCHSVPILFQDLSHTMPTIADSSFLFSLHKPERAICYSDLSTFNVV